MQVLLRRRKQQLDDEMEVLAEPHGYPMIAIAPKQVEGGHQEQKKKLVQRLFKRNGKGPSHTQMPYNGSPQHVCVRLHHGQRRRCHHPCPFGSLKTGIGIGTLLHRPPYSRGVRLDDGVTAASGIPFTVRLSSIDGIYCCDAAS
jgi:hypothetical protein